MLHQASVQLFKLFVALRRCLIHYKIVVLSKSNFWAALYLVVLHVKDGSRGGGVACPHRLFLAMLLEQVPGTAVLKKVTISTLPSPLCTKARPRPSPSSSPPMPPIPCLPLGQHPGCEGSSYPLQLGCMGAAVSSGLQQQCVGTYLLPAWSQRWSFPA